MSEKHADFNYCSPRPGTEILYSACPCWDAVTKKKRVTVLTQMKNYGRSEVLDYSEGAPYSVQLDQLLGMMFLPVSGRNVCSPTLH